MQSPSNNSQAKTYKRPQNYIGDSQSSPRYVDSSTEHNEDPTLHSYESNDLQLQISKLQNFLQESEKSNTFLQNQINERENEIQELLNLQTENEEKIRDYENLHHKY